MVASLSWMADGLTSDEWHIVTILRDIVSEDLHLAKTATTLPWLADSITWYETQMLAALGQITFEDINLAKMVITLPWVTDGVTSDHETGTLYALLNIVTADPQLATSVLTLPWTDSQWDKALNHYFLHSLGSIAARETEALSQLTTQSWFADGLSEEEAALVVTLPALVHKSPTLYQDLLRAHYTQTRTVSLSLAGNVKIWVIQATPFPPDEDLVTNIEDAAHIMEGFLKVPFPTTDIILLVADQSYGVGGVHAGSHMRLVRSDWYDGREVEVGYIPHETAHYYFSAGSTGPAWLTEGAAEFIQAYVNDLMGVQDLNDRRIKVSRSTQLLCTDGKDEFENIRHYVYVSEYRSDCHYDMGENLLHALFEMMGEAALRTALRDLYLMELVKDAEWDEHSVEDRIFLTFLEHTPPEKREAFRNLYRRLHGGPYEDPDADHADDHGDEASAASEVAVGDVIEGTLEYMWDFDYFRFQAEEDQVYWMDVTHETLRASSIYVYAPDGQTKLRWIIRDRVSTGPRILWESQNSGKYYFAVHNFGGKTGRYTLTITPLITAPDDHGDTTATATDISVKDVVNGSIDYGSDIDIFRFQAVDGRQYWANLRFGTLKDGLLMLYTPKIGSYPGHSGPAWTSGEHYYIVFSLHGGVGTYTLETDGENESSE